jgi:hypothetical protein
MTVKQTYAIVLEPMEEGGFLVRVRAIIQQARPD